MISVERVDELRSEVGEDDFEEIVALFMAESGGIIDRLRSAAGPEEAEELLHTLRGSALNLGFETLAALCSERQGVSPGSDAWAARLDRILGVFAESRSRLEALV